MLTPRAFAALALPILLIGLGSLLQPLLWVGAAGLVLVLIALVADGVLAPRAKHFEVQRVHDKQLTLAVDNTIALEVTQTGGRSTAILARDELPPTWHASTLLLDARHLDEEAPAAGQRPGARVRLQPGYMASLRYTVRPPRRGNYAFGNANLRWLGPIGLVQRQAAFPLPGEVKVFPNLQGSRKYDLLVKQGRMVESGLRTVRTPGDGSDFERLRDYLPDDQPRNIDWRATARRSKITVRQLQAERSQNIIALLDAGRLMQAPGEWVPDDAATSTTADLQKIDYAVNAALMLCYVAGQRGDKVGALAFADRVIHHLAPRSGRGQFYSMLNTLYALQAAPIESNYEAAFAHLATHQRRRALVVVFSDMQDGVVARDVVARLTPLKRNHLVLLVTMSDASVVAITRKPVATEDEVYRRAVAEQVLETRARVLETLRENGILTLDVPADRLSIAVVNRYLELKARQVI